MASETYPLFCMGNPLLDMQVRNGEALLKKYKLNSNDAILAGPEQFPIYEEVVKDYNVTYVAGGASQNTARGAAYVLPPNSVVYTGCVGDDDLAEQLRAANKREGLTDAYLIKKGEKSGACVVVITGDERSLVTDLRSAEKFEQSHLSSPAVSRLVDAARVFYVEGYFLTHGLQSMLELGKKASQASKVFALNLSAPFIVGFGNGDHTFLSEVVPYCDIIIGNEAEAAVWASANKLPANTDLRTIAKALATEPKANSSRPRHVIFTQGADSTIVVSSAEPDSPKVYPVIKVDNIVDTNGAGDAFAGGFLGAFVAGKSIDDCVDAGHKMGAMCVQQVGPQYQWPKVQIL